MKMQIFVRMKVLTLFDSAYLIFFKEHLIQEYAKHRAVLFSIYMKISTKPNNFLYDCVHKKLIKIQKIEKVDVFNTSVSF